jgi:hypothetical protein
MQTRATIDVVDKLKIKRDREGGENQLSQVCRRLNNGIPQYSRHIEFSVGLVPKIFRKMNTILDGSRVGVDYSISEIFFKVPERAGRRADVGEDLLGEYVIGSGSLEFQSRGQIRKVEQTRGDGI